MRARGLLNPLLMLSLSVVLMAAVEAPTTRRSTMPSATTASAAPTNRPTTAPSPAVAIVLHGDIDKYTHATMERRFAQARKLGARTVIIDIKTNGGELDAAEAMTNFLKNQADLHTIAFVNAKAYSAGAILSVAADEIFMSPHSKMGASDVIAVDQMGQIQELSEDVQQKFRAPIIADLNDSATDKYPAILLHAMVLPQLSVHWMQGPEGERRFVDEAGRNELAEKGWTVVTDLPDPIDTKTTLLTLTDHQAAVVGVSSGTARSAQEVADRRGATLIATLDDGFGDKLVAWLANPIIRSLLLTIFLSALYAAMHAPGHGAAEVIAVVTLAALLGVPLLTGHAQWWEIVAILAGISLLAIELFVIPGFGVAGITGIVLILLGMIMTFVPEEPGGIPGFLPSLPGTWMAVQRGLLFVVAGMVCSLLLSLWLRRFLPKLPYVRGLVLTATSGNIADGVSGAPFWPPAGAVGHAATDLCPGGSAEFVDPASGHTRVISVICDSGFVDRGAELVVEQNSGNEVVVRPARERA